VVDAGRKHDVTVAELVLAYRKFAATYYAPPSRESPQIRLALQPVVDRYAHTLAKDFGPLSLKAVRQTWIDAGLARRYINQRVGRVVRAWAWAVENEMLPALSWQSLKAVKGLRAGRSAAREPEPVRHRVIRSRAGADVRAAGERARSQGNSPVACWAAGESYPRHLAWFGLI